MKSILAGGIPSVRIRSAHGKKTAPLEDADQPGRSPAGVVGRDLLPELDHPRPQAGPRRLRTAETPRSSSVWGHVRRALLPPRRCPALRTTSSPRTTRGPRLACGTGDLRVDEHVLDSSSISQRADRRARPGSYLKAWEPRRRSANRPSAPRRRVRPAVRSSQTRS